MGCNDCEWITFNYLSHSEGSQSQRLKAVDMDHVPSHSAFNPAHVIKDGRGGKAAATSGWDGEGILIQCEPFCPAKSHYLTTLKLLQSLPRPLPSFPINSLPGLMKESCLMKNHHRSSSTHLELTKPLNILDLLTAIHLPMVIWINSVRPMDWYQKSRRV